MKPMPKVFKVTFVIAVAVVLASAVLVPAFIRARTTPCMNACFNNLLQLDGAKQQWALESRHAKGDPVAWEDVNPYLRRPLVCPRGGAYILGRIGELPRCSIGADHSLPPDTDP
jgi:hypothetical protein